LSESRSNASIGYAITEKYDGLFKMFTVLKEVEKQLIIDVTLTYESNFAEFEKCQ
jgi:hypothetical protein